MKMSTMMKIILALEPMLLSTLIIMMMTAATRLTSHRSYRLSTSPSQDVVSEQHVIDPFIEVAAHGLHSPGNMLGVGDAGGPGVCSATGTRGDHDCRQGRGNKLASSLVASFIPLTFGLV